MMNNMKELLLLLPLLHDDEASEQESRAGRKLSYLLAAVLGLATAIWVYFGYTEDETAG